MSGHWVFGYGSLMWRPGFAYEEAQPALMRGVHRSLCIYSHVHRGTPERPGLVLGLDRGGACRGMAFRVAEHLWPDTLRYLRAREQATAVYVEQHRPIRLIERGETVSSLCYVVDRTHAQYAGRIALDDMLAFADAEGQSGTTRDYILSTVEQLARMKLSDRDLGHIAKRLGGRDPLLSTPG